MYYTLAPQGGGGGRKLTNRWQAVRGRKGTEMGDTPFSLAAARHPPPPRPGTRPGIMSIIGVPFLLSPGVRVVLHTPYS